MRKISTFCRLERNFCRAIFACSLVCAGARLGWSAEILPPDPPQAEAPPTLGPGHSWEDRQRTRRQDERKEQQKSEDARASQKAADIKTSEILKPREYYGFSELSFYFAKALVSQGRSGYSIDPGVQFSTYIRSFWNRSPYELQPWYGLRVAPFSGYGSQRGTTVRFAHTWMGPALGLGRFWPPDDPRENGGASHSMLLSAGLAGVSRLTNPRDKSVDAPEDFQPTPWSNDGGGAWSELRWSSIRLGALGFGGLIGFQTGSGKIFTYLSATCSAYY